MFKNILALVLIIYGAFGNNVFSIIPKNPNPPEPPAVAILNVDKPNESTLQKVAAFSDLITDSKDRAKLAIFNYQFAKNVLGYETDVQKANDVYVLAAKKFFQTTMKDKYPGLSAMIISLISDVSSDDNHILTQEEKNKISENFMGVAWVLIQKRGENK